MLIIKRILDFVYKINFKLYLKGTGKMGKVMFKVFGL